MPTNAIEPLKGLVPPPVLPIQILATVAEPDAPVARAVPSNS